MDTDLAGTAVVLTSDKGVFLGRVTYPAAQTAIAIPAAKAPHPDKE